ncbi:MAG: Fic family protein [Bacilli bacterium]|nr:Fic family protein [Bacilli bacterium]MDD4734138.1 Fic family protein [Bacilli bacterium]
MEKYTPPFSITNKMLDLVATIMEKIGKLDNYNSLNKMPTLRRNNRINSIHSSLAIEANSLSLNQVKDIINGKMVLGPQKEIQEVKDAYKAYEMIKEVSPYLIKDLLKVHGVMTYLTLDESGVYRSSGEGVFDGDKCIFMAPPQDRVPELIENLFSFMKREKDNINPLILSSIFHYEFVFIHPFTDGNGRMARLWQTVILSNYKEVFEYLPIENQIKKYQEEYYDSIAHCHINGNSNEFIEFMLKMFDEVLDEIISSSSQAVTQNNVYLIKLLDAMDSNIPMTANQIMKKLNIKSKETFRANYLDPALNEGLVKMTIPDKPTSKNQMYYKV